MSGRRSFFRRAKSWLCVRAPDAFVFCSFHGIFIWDFNERIFAVSRLFERGFRKPSIVYFGGIWVKGLNTWGGGWIVGSFFIVWDGRFWMCKGIWGFLDCWHFFFFYFLGILFYFFFLGFCYFFFFFGFSVFINFFFNYLFN